MSRIPTHSLACCLGLLLVALPASGQLRNWASPTTGSWTSPARWSPADIPDTPAESATFDLFGTFAANLGVASLSINDLTISRGDVTLRTTGLADSTLQLGGDFAIGGAVTLADTASTFVRPQVAGQLSLSQGASLLAEGGGVSASATSVAGGTTTSTTRLDLRGTVASLGDVSVAETGAAGSRGELLAFDGTQLSVAALDVATVSPHATAQVSIVASTLTQSAGSLVTIGRQTEAGATGRATLSVSDAGELRLAGAVVAPTGKLLVLDASTIAIAESLEVDGGLYEERDAVTRDFSQLDTLTARNGGVIRLFGQSLTLGAGQKLAVASGSLESTSSLLLTAGGLLEASGPATSVIDAPVTLTPTGEAAALAGSALRFADAFNNQGGAFSVATGATVTFAGDYRGAGTTGQGSVVFAGSVEPGQGVGVAAMGGAVSFAPTASLRVEIAGATSHDRLTAGGGLTLGGALHVELLDGGGLFQPQAGDAFRVVEAGSLVGAFTTLNLPTLSGGLGWRVLQTHSSLTLRVVAPSAPGDFNHDGAIDAADYSIWRDTAGSTGALLAADADGNHRVDGEDLSIWRSAYGGPAPSVAVPEPTSALRISFLLALFLARRRIRL